MPPARPRRPSRDLDLTPEANDATMVDVRVPDELLDEPRPAGGARLRATRGPKSGDVFPLEPGENTIGRQSGNGIVIPDISVSRRHVVVHSERGRYRLVDLGSGNGTLLNGARVEGESELADGDRIVMGDTELVLELPQQPRRAPSRPAALARAEVDFDAEEPLPQGEPTNRFTIDPVALRQGRKRRLRGVIALLLVAVGLVFGGVLFRKHQQGKLHDEQAALAKAAETEAAIVAAIEGGKSAAKGGDFRGAAEAFEKALGFIGETGEGRRDVENRLDYARKEAEVQAVVEKCTAALAAGQLAAARTLLGQIPEDSYFNDRVPELTGTLKAKLPERLAAGKAALEAKNLDEARKALDDLRAVDAQASEAEALARAIEAASEPKERKPTKTAAAPASSADPTDAVFDAFKAGNLDEAVNLAQRCDHARCKPLREKLQAFRAAYRELSAPGNAERAASLLRSLPGGMNTPYAATLAGRGVTAMVNEGIKALAADNLPKAFQSFHRALQLDPENAMAEKHMRTIRQKARELFDQAYVDKGVDPDKARHEFEQVLQLTAPGEELNTKAKKHLKSLGGG